MSLRAFFNSPTIAISTYAHTHTASLVSFFFLSGLHRYGCIASPCSRRRTTWPLLHVHLLRRYGMLWSSIAVGHHLIDLGDLLFSVERVAEIQRCGCHDTSNCPCNCIQSTVTRTHSCRCFFFGSGIFLSGSVNCFTRLGD